MEQALHSTFDGKTNQFFSPAQPLQEAGKEPPQTGTQKEEAELAQPAAHHVDQLQSFELDANDDVTKKGGEESSRDVQLTKMDVPKVSVAPKAREPAR